jgi:hypothetical protein
MERIWKETVVLSEHLTRSERTHEKTSLSISSFRTRYLKLGYPEFERRLLSTQLRYMIAEIQYGLLLLFEYP